MSEDLRDRIARAITDIPTATDLDPAPPDDEIVAAISRQLDVVEGTVVVLSNVLQMLALQVANLRAEVALFDSPDTTVREEDQEAQRTSDAPDPSDAPSIDYCGHTDALIVDTAVGKVKVCPDCDG